MKRKILVGLFACFAMIANAQNLNLDKGAISSAGNQEMNMLSKGAIPDLASVPKTLLCNDTIRYPQIKEQLLNATASFYTFTLWTDDQEYMSQAYLHTGGSLTISQIEFFGNKNTAGAASVTVEGSIYNVNATNTPTTLISSGTMTLTSTVSGYNYITLSTPAVVTGNYAVVIRPTNANARLDLFINNIITLQPQDEGLSKSRSTFYPQSNGNWVSIPVLTNDAVNFTAVYDFEALISPIVSYTINTDAVAVTSPACQGTAVQYNNNTTPTGILNSRMYNYQRFNLHFNVATSDSTYAWDMDNASPVIWSSTTNYTHPSAGTYDVTLFTLAGFWTSCTDNDVVQVVINPASDATFAYSGNTFCAGSSNQTPTVNASGTFTSSPAGLVFVSASTGEINMAASTNGTYTVTHSITGACPSTAQQPITITTAPLGEFSYSQSGYCQNDVNQSPIFGVGASGGVFTSNLVGLSISSSGVINPSLSVAGAYIVTNSITGGGCPAVNETFAVFIDIPPTVTFATLSSVCISDPSFQLTGGTPAMGVYSGTGVNAGMFSPSIAGAGIHPITYSFSSSNGCSASATQSITVGDVPTVTMAPFSGELCENDAAIPLPVATPAGGIYTGTGVLGSNFEPGISGDGTFNITYTYESPEGCQAFDFQSVTVNPAPNATLGALADVCENHAPFTLTGGLPAGGTYSGPGVDANGVFDPATAGEGTHTITYTVTNAEGCEDVASNEIVVADCASIDQLSDFNLNIYPNPADDIIHVSYQIAGTDLSTISLLTLDGKVVVRNEVQGQIVNANLNVSSFAAGIYFVQLEFVAKKVIRKVVIE